ncbi:hypothetical protein BHE74_00019879 [Ensete ventricosum]|nr:hypothetical protein BHE74_00019879 [Ensete ventricosum]
MVAVTASHSYCVYHPLGWDSNLQSKGKKKKSLTIQEQEANYRLFAVWNYLKNCVAIAATHVADVLSGRDQVVHHCRKKEKRRRRRRRGEPRRRERNAADSGRWACAMARVSVSAIMPEGEPHTWNVRGQPTQPWRRKLSAFQFLVIS